MKSKKFSKMIQGPLRFHHQDIHEELEELRNQLTYLRGVIHTMSRQIQDLHEDLQNNYKPEKVYEHPWYKIKKEMIESV